MDESKRPTGPATPGAATSWPLAGPASPCPPPESVSAWMIRATAGHSSRTPLASYDHASRSWSAAQLPLLRIAEDTGLAASPIWPESGCMLGGSCFELPMPALPTAGAGSGASAGEPWPTPMANDASGGSAAHRMGDGSYGSPSLARVAAEWPTPTAGDAKASGAQGYSTESGRHPGTTLTDAAVREWPTPTAQTYGSNQGGSAGRVGPVRPSLEAAARDWPTPQAHDAKGAGRDTGGRNSDNLNCQVVAAAKATSDREWPTPHWMSGQGPRHAGPTGNELGRAITETDGTALAGGKMLNPRWVEALQGWPLGIVGLPSEIAGQLLAALRKKAGSRRAPAASSPAAPTS